jgi:glycosyltransferase involved in cell wall biosynthesis
LAEVFSVVSSYAENTEAWRSLSIPRLEVRTYRGLPEAFLSWVNQLGILRLASKIRDLQPDVLYFPMLHTWAPFLLTYLREIPSVVTIHDPVPHPGLAARINGIVEDAVLRKATRCVVLSHRFVVDLERRGVSSDRIDVIPLGPLDYEAECSPLPERALVQARPVLLFFGRITQYKGLDILLQAYKHISERWPNAGLRIVGSGDLAPYQPLLRQLPNVEIENRWVNDAEIPDMLKGAMTLVLPYTSATQSGVVAVAASLGLPVIATRVGGLPEQITDGYSGILVAPGSVEQLTNAIERVIANPEWAKELGNNLKRDFDENRNWGKVSAMIYESCVRATEARKSR